MFENEIKEYLQKHNFEALTPKVVLFDMDGVLYDSMPNHTRAWLQAMKSFGIRMTEADSYATEGMRGVETIQMMVRQQQGREISEEEAQKMYDEKGRLFLLMPPTPIFDGVKELMQQIKASKLTIGIVTGSAQKPLIKRLIDDFQPFIDPSHIVTAYSVKHGKPAPDPYLMGLKLTGGYQPYEAIVVENAPMGIRAGVAAQIFTVAINSGPLPDSTLKAEGANLLFSRITDFRDAWNELLQAASVTRNDTAQPNRKA